MVEPVSHSIAWTSRKNEIQQDQIVRKKFISFAKRPRDRIKINPSSHLLQAFEAQNPTTVVNLEERSVKAKGKYSPLIVGVVLGLSVLIPGPILYLLQTSQFSRRDSETY